VKHATEVKIEAGIALALCVVLALMLSCQARAEDQQATEPQYETHGEYNSGLTFEADVGPQVATGLSQEELDAVVKARAAAIKKLETKAVSIVSKESKITAAEDRAYLRKDVPPGQVDVRKCMAYVALAALRKETVFKLVGGDIEYLPSVAGAAVGARVEWIGGQHQVAAQ
jgi:hypothetical protein